MVLRFGEVRRLIHSLTQVSKQPVLWTFRHALHICLDIEDVLLKLGLCPLVPNRNAETEFWVKEKKIAFIALSGKGGHSRLML